MPCAPAGAAIRSKRRRARPRVTPTDMKLVIFSVEEANQLLDEIRPRMRRLVVAKRHFDQLQARVDLLKVITEGAADGNADLRELAELRKRQRAYAEMISEGVQAVHRRGCLIKDLDRG